MTAVADGNKKRCGDGNKNQGGNLQDPGAYFVKYPRGNLMQLQETQGRFPSTAKFKYFRTFFHVC